MVSICGEDNYFIICSNTNRLTRILLSIILILLAQYNFSIINQHLVNAKCFLDIAFICVIFVCLTNFNSAVFQNCKICRLFTIGYVITVHNKHTGGFTGCHIVVRRINTSNNRSLIIGISCRCLFVKSSNLFGQLGHTIRGIVHILVGCKHFYGINTRIDCCCKELYLFSIFVVNSVKILRDTLCQGGCFVCYHGQLRLCKAYSC